jgi:hypothetical protein
MHTHQQQDFRTALNYCKLGTAKLDLALGVEGTKSHQNTDYADTRLNGMVSRSLELKVGTSEIEQSMLQQYLDREPW